MQAEDEPTPKFCIANIKQDVLGDEDRNDWEASQDVGQVSVTFPPPQRGQVG